ncbi:MAG: hypothetical protein GY868_01545 [Deltaproteobacteria bacterium]|nr:hypothetical protein [Deltaproteobacteria bacterium]
MKILSPLDSCDEVGQLADAGAGEFFCGVLEESWYDSYPVISINRRPAGKGHFRSFALLQEAVARAHERAIPVYFTLNEHYYIQDQYSHVMRYIDSALSAGVDALIVSDFGLMAYLREQQYAVPLHVSTGGTVFNWRAANFFCSEFGVENITFPRHLTMREIGSVAERMDPVNTTVFVLNSRCINVDGFCTFQHGLAGKDIFPMFRNACMLPFQVRTRVAETVADRPDASRIHKATDRQKIWERVHVDDHPCGVCALHELKALGVNSLKIVGRGNPVERKLSDVAFVKKMLTYLEQDNPDARRFHREVQQHYTETYERPCRMHMCYFPEVLEADE